MVSAGLGETAARLLAPVRNVGPAFTVFDPVYGKRLKKKLRCERITPEFRMRLTTNALGFRGPEPPAASRGGIVFLGDSFTLGYGVDDGQEYPDLVRRILGVTGINAGIGNAGNGHWILFLRREAARFHPWSVVLQLSANDFEDNLTDGLFRLGPAGDLRELTPPRRYGARVIQETIEAIPGLSYSYLVGLLRQATERAARRAGPRAADDALTCRLLEEALDLCRARGWPAVGLSADLEEGRLAAVETVFAASGSRLLRAPLKRDRPDLYYRVDGHWNPAGHAWVARQVADALLEDPRFKARAGAAATPAR